MINKDRFSKWISVVSALVFFLILTFSGGTLAAGSIYNLDSLSGNVGSHTHQTLSYTVDASDQTWASGDVVEFVLPPNYPDWSDLTFTVEYDTDIRDDGIGEITIAQGNGNGEYALSGKTLSAKWDLVKWGAVISSQSTVRVVVTAGLIPFYEDAASTFAWGGSTANATDSNPQGFENVAVLPAVLGGASVVPDRLNKGVGSSLAVSFVATGFIPADGKIILDLPDGFLGTGVNTINGFNASGVANVGGFSVTASNGGGVNDLIEITRNGSGDIIPIGSTVQFSLPGVINPNVSGGTGVYSIKTLFSGGQLIAQDHSIQESVMTSSDDYLVSGGNPVNFPKVGSASVALPTITLTSSGSDDFLNQNNEEEIEIEINSVDYPGVIFNPSIQSNNILIGGTCGHSNALSGFIYTSSKKARLFFSKANSNPCANGETITIDGLEIATSFAQSAPGSSPLVLIDNVQTSKGQPVASSDQINLPVLAGAGSISDIVVTPDPLSVNDTVSLNFRFKIGSPLPADGKIGITLPNGYDLTNTNSVSSLVGLSEAPSTLTVLKFSQPLPAPQVPQAILISRSGVGSAVTAGTTIGLTLDNVKVPSSITPLSIGQMVTTDATQTPIDSNINFVFPAIEPDQLVNAIVSPNITKISTSGQLVVDFTTVNLIPAAGIIYIVVDDRFDTSNVNLNSFKNIQNITGNFNLIKNTASGYTAFALNRAGGGGLPIPAGTRIRFDIADIITPSQAGIVKPYQIIILDGSGATIEEDRNISPTHFSASGNVGSSSASGSSNNSSFSRGGGGGGRSGGTARRPIPVESESQDFLGKSKEMQAGAELKKSASVRFRDIDSHWAEHYITDLAEQGILNGKSSILFKPKDFITRAELIKVAVLAFDIDQKNEDSAPYSDVAIGKWYTSFIRSAKAFGLIKEARFFNPNQFITRAEAIKVLIEAVSISDLQSHFEVNYHSKENYTYVQFKDVGINKWYAPYVAYAFDFGWVQGYKDNSFRPNQPISRAEIAKIVSVMLSK